MAGNEAMQVERDGRTYELGRDGRWSMVGSDGGKVLVPTDTPLAGVLTHALVKRCMEAAGSREG